MAIVLGIDPGSRKTGYGLIHCASGNMRYVSSGVIRLPVDEAMPERLKLIYESVSQIIEQFQPQQVVVEQVFMAKNASSALKLGHARGAAIVAAATHGLEVFEYEARKIKQSVVGHGAADKSQVQHMVKSLLKLPKTPQEDAADALAACLCHINTYNYMVRVAQSKNFRRGRLV